VDGSPLPEPEVGCTHTIKYIIYERYINDISSFIGKHRAQRLGVGGRTEGNEIFRLSMVSKPW
jgi:hypothetical protein